MDIMLIILMVALSILFIFVFNYIFEKNGIKNIYLIYNVISFILSFKILEIVQININANIIVSSMFNSLTYFIIEKTTPREYKEIIKQTLTVNIIIAFVFLISSLYIGSVNDTITVHMNNIFIKNYKILIGYPIITTINQILILLIYNNIKSEKINNNLRMIITNLNVLMAESILFIITGYIFKIDFIHLLILIISNYLIKVLITSIYTPFTNYIIKEKKVKL